MANRLTTLQNCDIMYVERNKSRRKPLNLHILEKLDYDVYTDEDRVEFVRDLLDSTEIDNFENPSVQKQLEGVANYILYGKSAITNKSDVDKKAIFIKAKNNSFKKKEPDSLEALQETLTFNESKVQPYYQRNIYTKPKQKISRIDDKDVPYMEELWHTIDQMQRIYNISIGKEEPTQEEIDKGKILTGLRLYKWRHWLIDVRRHQFYLKDSHKRQVHFTAIQQPNPHRIDWDCDSFYFKEDGTFHLIREHTLDFTDPHHIYCILENYSALMQESYEDLDGSGRYILYSLDEIIEKTDLSKDRLAILIWKIDKKSNLRIAEFLQKKYGKTYTENYISTIWKQEICTKIAKQAELEEKKFLYKGKEGMWKTCRVCGERKLLEEFVKKTGTKDGHSNRCKKCDKDFRKK